VSERDESSGSVKEIARREFCRRWGLRCSIVALLALATYGGFRVYGSWREGHLARQTQQFVARGEYQSAVLVARRLLALNPDNLTALRAMAEMAENAGRADAVTWRTKIAHAEPGVPEHQLALARTAMRFGQSALAENVLRSLPEGARRSAKFHQVAGALALSLRDAASAEGHFAAAVEAEPANPQFALNLAIVRLATAAGAEQARASLAQLATDPAVRTEALRALAADALARSSHADAAKWATQLKNEERFTFADALVYFQAVQGTDAAAPALEELKAKAAQSPATAAELITWLNRNQMAIVAEHWSTQLPKEIAEAQPVPLAIAEAYSFRKDWLGMQAWVEGKNWGDYEALRLAVESHALHRLAPADRPSAETQTVWRAALKAAQKRPEQLVAIAQLAEGWGYTSDAEEAWWLAANTSDHARAGLSALQRIYKAKQDTRGLWRVARRAIELNPRDLVAANNYASFGLLLTGDSTSRRLAAKLHADHPTNGAFAATYAFALQLEGKLADALKLMETLKEEELRHPAIAAYYVMMLVESGNIDRARTFLAHAKRATLLPEEQQLLTAATRKLLASETPARSKTAADF
jgi:Flp pilus assembly protein TadD